MLEQHEAASHSSDSTLINVSEPAGARGLIDRFQQWAAGHQKQLLLWRAKLDAAAGAVSLELKHTALEKQINEQRGSSSQTSPVAQERTGNSREESAAIVKNTMRRAADQKALTILDKRIRNDKRLPDTYGKCISVVAPNHRPVFPR